MGLISKMLHNTIELGDKVADAVGDAAVKTGNDIMLSKDKAALALKIKVAEDEINACYEELGRRYVTYMRETKKQPNMKVIGDVLKDVIAKILHKEALERELEELERQDQQLSLMTPELREKKLQLDRALEMQIITEEEYNAKLVKFIKSGSF